MTKATLDMMIKYATKFECSEISEGVVATTTLGNTLGKLQLLCLGVSFSLRVRPLGSIDSPVGFP